jgi:hypothetical protein
VSYWSHYWLVLPHAGDVESLQEATPANFRPFIEELDEFQCMDALEQHFIPDGPEIPGSGVLHGPQVLGRTLSHP